MPRNGSGVYTLPAGNPVVSGTTISSTWANNTLSDIGTALTASISKDGQTTLTANLPMSGFKLTGLAAGTANGDSVRYEQAAKINGSGENSDITSLSSITSINGSALAGMRNRITNGNFSINQRVYVSGAAVGAGLYGHDRWKMAASADTYTFSTADNVTTVTIPSGKVLQQVIEGLNLETGTYCLSWQGTAQGKIGAGSYDASGITGSITGGTNTTIEFGPGTVSNVQLEYGTVATTFEHRTPNFELLECQRHAYAPVSEYIGNAFGTNGVNGAFVFPVTMRAAPTLAAGSAFGVNTGSAGVPAFDTVTKYSGRFTNSSNNWTIGAIVTITAVLSADL